MALSLEFAAELIPPRRAKVRPPASASGAHADSAEEDDDDLPTEIILRSSDETRLGHCELGGVPPRRRCAVQLPSGDYWIDLRRGDRRHRAMVRVDATLHRLWVERGGAWLLAEPTSRVAQPIEPARTLRPHRVYGDIAFESVFSGGSSFSRGVSLWGYSIGSMQRVAVGGGLLLNPYLRTGVRFGSTWTLFPSTGTAGSMRMLAYDFSAVAALRYAMRDESKTLSLGAELEAGPALLAVFLGASNDVGTYLRGSVTAVLGAADLTESMQISLRVGYVWLPYRSTFGSSTDPVFAGWLFGIHTEARL
jgi:hypothetical protein